MLLDVTDLSVDYRTSGRAAHALSGVSFSVAAGEVVALVGESGSGKSTAALAALGLVRPGAQIVGGSVSFDGEELLEQSEEQLERVRGRQIGLITQSPRASLNPVMRVGDQISAVIRAHTDAVAAAAREHVIELLRVVGINDPERRYAAFPHELSGGMAQRVLIAMALSAKPKLLIADEPTSGLDVTIQAQVLDDLRRAVTTVGSSLLVVTQDLGIVANYCDRLYLMHAGEVVEVAPTLPFFDSPLNPAGAALVATQRRAAQEVFALDGLPIDVRALPQGCWLASRCPFADPAAGCTTEHPPLYDVGPGRLSRCHRHEVVAAAVARHLAPEPGLPMPDVPTAHARPEEVPEP
jgi:oligopeptide/dipeptide ABC transporter ATP-binding protein